MSARELKVTRGDFVSINGDIGVVTHTFSELENFDQIDSDDKHIGVWFGNIEDGQPKVKTIPLEYCKSVKTCSFHH